MTNDQQPDLRSGSYYVSFIDGKRYGLAAGPFAWHKDALAYVDRARKIGEELDPRAFWYAWGTCRLEPGHPKYGALGILNRELGLAGLAGREFRK